MKRTSTLAFLVLFSLFIALFACLNRGSKKFRANTGIRDTLFVEVAGNLRALTPNAPKPQYKFRIPIIPRGYVNDYVDLFSVAQKASLDSLIAAYEKATTNEVAIITIDSSWMPKDSLQSFVTKVHNNWGVGKKDKNNGIVVGICATQRFIRISNGYGIEKQITNDETKTIIDSLIAPDYRNGNYFEGTRKGLIGLMQKVK